MNQIKVLHLATYARGGAGSAARRLNASLRAAGVSSSILFLDGEPNRDGEKSYRSHAAFSVFWRKILKKVFFYPRVSSSNSNRIKNFTQKFEVFSFARTSFSSLVKHPLLVEADVIHLHWISDFIDFPTFFPNVKKPIVWTLHDLNPMLGGYHYDDDSRLGLKDLEREDYEQKLLKQRTVSSSFSVTIVGPSTWIVERSMKSLTLGKFSHCLIRNPIPLQSFKVNVNERVASASDKLKVLFVAERLENRRKGFDLITEILNNHHITDKFEFSAVGRVDSIARVAHVKYFGSITNETQMARIYSDSDFFIIPSREDNLPNCLVESLCCGTPVIGFRVGGIPELIVPGKNGYICNEVNSESLAAGLLDCAKLKFNRHEIAVEARKTFSFSETTGKYLDLYHALTADLNSQNSKSDK